MSSCMLGHHDRHTGGHHHEGAGGGELHGEDDHEGFYQLVRRHPAIKDEERHRVYIINR